MSTERGPGALRTAIDQWIISSMSYKYCCDEFGQAQADGTDNEGHLSLIRGDDGVWTMGMKLPPIEYCPWCGAKLRLPPSAEELPR